MIKDFTFTKQVMTDYQLNLKQERGALLMQLVSAQRLIYLNTLDLHAAGLHESALLAMATDALLDIPGCSIIGQAPKR